MKVHIEIEFLRAQLGSGWEARQVVTTTCAAEGEPASGLDFEALAAAISHMVGVVLDARRLEGSK